MFKIKLRSGKFYVGGKDRRVWYFATATEARKHAKKHHLKGARIMQVHMKKHGTNKSKGVRKGKGKAKGHKGRKGHRGRRQRTSFADIYGTGFF
jgi:hypothetical protein